MASTETDFPWTVLREHTLPPAVGTVVPRLRTITDFPRPREEPCCSLLVRRKKLVGRRPGQELVRLYTAFYQDANGDIAAGAARWRIIVTTDVSHDRLTSPGNLKYAMLQ